MSLRAALLMCGVAAALIYTFTDLAAAWVYSGYSIRDQAVSELFAIGAPTSWFVVPLFSLSSVLLLGFAAGIWLSSGGRRLMRFLAFTFAASGVNALVLWNVFPMHMRGDARTLTDQMHLILSVNPFVLIGLAAAAIAFRGAFRLHTLVTIALVVLPAAFAFRLAPVLDAGLPTPWLGFAERVAQYAYEAWQCVLSLVLLRAGQTRAASAHAT